MKQWLLAMWNDAATFKGAALLVASVFGAAIVGGEIPDVPPWVGYVLVAGSSVVSPAKKSGNGAKASHGGGS